MKKIIFGSILLLSLFGFIFSCDSTVNDQLFDETIGEKTETVPPEEVSELKADAYEKAVVLSWINPTDKDFYGLTITATPAEGTLENPVTFMNDDATLIPSAFTITSLSEEKTYTFNIITFDHNLNKSTGVSITAIPQGAKLIIPDDVSELTATVLTEAVTLNWKNPEYEDFYGVTISALPATGSLESPITYMNTDKKKIPTTLAVTDLPGNVSYTFTVVAFDKKMNMAAGKTVTAKPEGINSTATDSFYGTDNIIGYKKNKIALDFGYCKEPTEKTVELIATSKLNMASTAFSGTGAFSLVSYEPTGDVNIGDKIKITVKYTPPATPSWNEMDLAIGNTGKNLTAIGSSFKQPNSASFKKTEKDANGNDIEYGVKLWLRADMITSEDIDSGTKKVKKLPDYSGRNLDAKCTDTTNNYSYAAVYVESDSIFNGLPCINFNQSSNTDIMRAQYMSIGNDGSPIINSIKGSTTFIIMKPDSYGTNQSYLSCNYGTAFPTLWTTNRQYNTGTNYWGLAVKGGGLYGTYRFPCETLSTTDEDNRWMTTDYNNASSYCLVFDKTIEANKGVKTNQYCDFPSNIRMWVKGQERLLSYIYSNGSAYTTDKNKTDKDYYYNGKVSCIRSTGKPVSDGKGHRYGGLTKDLSNEALNCETPSEANFLNNTYPTQNNNWKTAIENNTNGRSYDWAYIYTPANYVDKDGKWQNRDGQSTASGENGNNAGAYFYNWISNEDRRNGTIYNVILGADNVNTTYTKARIAEVIMFDYALSDQEIAEMNNYIYYRYGITSGQ